MLTDKMNEWKLLKQQLDNVEVEIIEEVALLKTSVENDGVLVKYSAGRRSYGYEALAGTAGASKEVINTNTKVTSKVDWKAVCSEVGYTADELEGVTTEGHPSVKISLSKVTS